MSRLSVVLMAAALVGLAACTHEKPNFVYMPDMAYSPAVKAQEVGSMIRPVEGTISRDYTTYPYLKDPEAAGKFLKNPVRPTAAILNRGQAVYSTYCAVCHGPQGEGDGSVVVPYPAGQAPEGSKGANRFPRPPSLQSDKVRTWPDGRIYHVIAAGQNLMPSYASQVAAGDRWALIHYIRALQRSKHPTLEDIKAAEQE